MEYKQIGRCNITPKIIDEIARLIWKTYLEPPWEISKPDGREHLNRWIREILYRYPRPFITVAIDKNIAGVCMGWETYGAILESELSYDYDMHRLPQEIEDMLAGKRTFWLGDVIVTQDHRGNGIGHKLIDLWYEFGEKEGYFSQMAFYTLHGSLFPRAYCQKLGFKPYPVQSKEFERFEWYVKSLK